MENLRENFGEFWGKCEVESNFKKVWINYLKATLAKFEGSWEFGIKKKLLILGKFRENPNYGVLLGD